MLTFSRDGYLREDQFKHLLHQFLVIAVAQGVDAALAAMHAKFGRGVGSYAAQ